MQEKGVKVSQSKKIECNKFNEEETKT